MCVCVSINHNFLRTFNFLVNISKNKLFHVKSENKFNSNSWICLQLVKLLRVLLNYPNIIFFVICYTNNFGFRFIQVLLNKCLKITHHKYLNNHIQTFNIA